MSDKILIDAGLPGETRVVVIDDSNYIKEFDYEQSHRVPIKGNIYLAKVTRVEASLQAAFVDYGGNRHGFLSFSEIHPDYFRIPVGDQVQYDPPHPDDENGNGDDDADDGVDEDEEAIALSARKQYQKLKRRYKIQEVIRRGQIMLVQAVKEERGSKGAAMTTYISLAGRYCVLMPNTDRGGGISRKIGDSKDRKQLKSIVSELQLPEGMGLIIRTAGSGQSRAEIRRDFNYISNTWNDIRALTLESEAPLKVYEEGNLLKRTLRDLYTKEVNEIVVVGKAAYDSCKKLMKSLMPSHVKKISLYDGEVPLFIHHGVEEKLHSISDSSVPLKSGGFLVLNQTEALVSIDVNSGRAIRERHIEETALHTNLEAVEEIARQLKLRDMAGLIVIDLITMENRRNNKAVEMRFREHLKADRARIQVGRISHFGLLELSRQRIRPSFLESIHEKCPMCEGGGFVPTEEFTAQSLIRHLEVEGHQKGGTVTVECSVNLATHLLNYRRSDLQYLKDRYNLQVDILVNNTILRGYHIQGEDAEESGDKDNSRDSGKEYANGRGKAGKRKQKRGRRGRRGAERQDERHDMQYDLQQDSQFDGDGGGDADTAPVESDAYDTEHATVSSFDDNDYGGEVTDEVPAKKAAKKKTAKKAAKKKAAKKVAKKAAKKSASKKTAAKKAAAKPSPVTDSET